MNARITSQILLVTVLVACSRSTERTTATSAPSPGGSSIDLSTVEIGLDRTECYGSCPNYSVVISGNGHVRYTGRTFVKVVGERDATIPESTIRELLGEFGRVNFVDLKDAYREDIFDHETVFLTLRLGERTKRIENFWAHGAFDEFEGVEADPDRKIHEQLDTLADAIDKAVRIEQWIGTVEERTALSEKLRDGSPGRMEVK